MRVDSIVVFYHASQISGKKWFWHLFTVHQHCWTSWSNVIEISNKNTCTTCAMFYILYSTTHLRIMFLIGEASRLDEQSLTFTTRATTTTTTTTTTTIPPIPPIPWMQKFTAEAPGGWFSIWSNGTHPFVGYAQGTWLELRWSGFCGCEILMILLMGTSWPGGWLGFLPLTVFARAVKRMSPMVILDSGRPWNAETSWSVDKFDLDLKTCQEISKKFWIYDFGIYFATILKFPWNSQQKKWKRCPGPQRKLKHVWNVVYFQFEVPI